MSDYLVVLFLATLFLVPLVLMSREDWNTCEVSGELCLVSWIGIATVMNTLASPGYIWAVVGLGCVVFYMPLEVPMFGDADIIPVVAALVFVLSMVAKGWSVAYWIIYPLCLLGCLVPYAKIWAHAKDVEWHFGSKQMVPMLPCFAIAWFLAIVCSVVIWLFGVR